MDFDFSPEQIQLRDTARRFLAARCPPSAVRAVMEAEGGFDRALWRGLAEMGFLGAGIPEALGGIGLGALEQCVIAEELGRAVAPVPFGPSIALAAELLLAAGHEAWLPRLADGTAIGTLALAEGAGIVTPEAIGATVRGGRLSGAKIAVPDGMDADIAIVAARDADGPALFLVALDQPGVRRQRVSTIDPSRGHATLTFADAEADRIGDWSLLEPALDRAAILCAFEQLGGAERSLEMARDHALERIAFGRPIGAFQAIKHMLADLYVAVTLARSNCYYAAWALSSGAAELPVAAATARVSATQAYQLCARQMVQIHGGMGFTWEADCHLHYRRTNLLALTLGGLSEWEDRLVDRLVAARKAAA